MVKWPTFITTTASDTRIVSDKGDRVIHTGRGLYYGLSWDYNYIYLLGRNCGHPFGPNIFSLDKDYTEVGTLNGPFLDGHQIHCDGERVYVTATSLNSIEVVDIKSNTTSVRNWTPHSIDTNHINSIWKDGDSFWVGYHGWECKEDKGKFKGSSKAVRVDSTLSTELEGHVVGHGNHNVVRVGDTLFICSSGDHKLVTYDLVSRRTIRSIDTGFWVRGISITDKYIVLGATEVSDFRSGRATGDSGVYLLDRATLDVLDKKVLRGTGSIYELRVTSEQDHAHNNITFPGKDAG